MSFILNLTVGELVRDGGCAVFTEADRSKLIHLYALAPKGPTPAAK